MRAVLFASFDSATWFCGSIVISRWTDAQVTLRVTDAPAASPRIVNVPTPWTVTTKTPAAPAFRSQIRCACHIGGMSNAEQRSDSELLLAARTRSEPFGVFYERHVASVLAFFRRRVPGAEEAFDLTAETFAAALAAVPRFEPGPEPPRAWLFAIARHKLSETLRSRRIQDEARRALAMQPIQLDDEGIDILETTARAGAVQLLENLAPEQRDAIKAHHLEERGYGEIAAELRCSESVIRKRVSRGLAALQVELRNGEAR